MFVRGLNTEGTPPALAVRKWSAGGYMSRAYDRGYVPTSVARLDRGYLPMFSLYDSHAGMFREGIGKLKCLRLLRPRPPAYVSSLAYDRGISLRPWHRLRPWLRLRLWLVTIPGGTTRG